MQEKTLLPQVFQHGQSLLLSKPSNWVNPWATNHTLFLVMIPSSSILFLNNVQIAWRSNSFSLSCISLIQSTSFSTCVNLFGSIIDTKLTNMQKLMATFLRVRIPKLTSLMICDSGWKWGFALSIISSSLGGDSLWLGGTLVIGS